MRTTKNTTKKLSLAYSTWDDKELNAIQDVIDSGMFTMGEKVNEFESNFSKYLGMNYSVMVNSGSSANLLMIATLFVQGKLKKGDEVIVPAVSWSTTFLPLQQYGLKVKFVDIDLHTLNIDLETLRQAITKDTKAIFIVNLLGNPIDKNKLNEIVDTSKIQIIEDNCESLGATFNGQKSGTFGQMSSHSFFFSHHISTMEGGMISTQDEEQYLILKSLRAHGWTRDLPESSKFNKKSDDTFYNMFNFVMPGYNLRPLEMSGAIGIEQLRKLDSFVEYRRKNAKAFQEVMWGKENILIQKDTCKSSWFGFSLINKEKDISPSNFRRKVTDLGFEIRPIVAGNFTRNEVINFFDYEIFGDLKNADYLHENGLFIGNNSVDISEDLQRLANL